MIYSSNKEQLIDALRENIIAIEYSLSYVKEDSNQPYWEQNKGCLGFPAIILMSSVIDTLGSVYDEVEILVGNEMLRINFHKPYTHYYILNHSDLFNLNLKKTTIEDFHQSFRDTLLHNNSLTVNSFLRKGSLNDEIFCFDEEYKIKEIRLVPLFEKIKVAVSIVIDKLEVGQYEIGNKMNEKLSNPTKNNIILSDLDTYELSGKQTI